MANIISSFIGILSRYGMDMFQIALISFCFWKLFTNHLKHLAQSVDDNRKEIQNTTKSVNKLSNRVSKIEGKLDK